MAKYKIVDDKSILDTENGMIIPLVSGNRHYREFVEWIELGNTPDASISSVEFKTSKSDQIKEAFNQGKGQGFNASSGRKYDASVEDYTLLKGALDLADIISSDYVKVRDFNNVVHTITPTELRNDIVELAIYFRDAFYAKWDAQDNVNGVGYSAYKNVELDTLSAIIEGNK